MELLAAYLYSRPPIESKNIHAYSFHQLKRNGWYSDSRNSSKFTLLNKRILHESQWYRVLIRFASTDSTGFYTLSSPCPFVITKCEPIDESELRWRDTKTYHGPKLNGVLGFLQEGVPIDVVDEVYKDLLNNVTYFE